MNNTTNTTETFSPINPDTFTGGIPAGQELIIMEAGGDPDEGMVLMGFDEIGTFDSQFINPVFGFVAA